MIQIKRFHGDIPAIAYTDFRFVYLSWLISKKEYDTAFLHEAGHIWLQHQYRQQVLQKEEGKSFNRQCWLIASDMEIAKQLYDAYDNAIITAPRSSLKGAITTKDTEKYPTCEYAEDFYYELKKENNEQQSTCCQCESDEELDDVDPQNVKDLIEQAKKEIEKIREQKQIQDTKEKIKDFKPPKPSLASEIDRHFGRTKGTRISSYRRPPRHESQDFIKKGMSSTARPPHLTLYVDRSGSFDTSKTATATSLIDTILKKYRGRITNDVIYFNDTLLSKDPINGGGGTNYQAVVDNIIKENAKLSIVITDDDGYSPDKKYELPPTIVVPVGASHTVLARVLSLKELSI